MANILIETAYEYHIQTMLNNLLKKPANGILDNN